MLVRVGRRRLIVWSVLGPLVLTAAAFAIVGFVEARPPEAPTDFEPYIHRTDGLRADPVNLVFRGANSDGVASAIARVLGWHFVLGSPMTFAVGSAEFPTAWQLGLDLGAGSRMHIRIQSVKTADDPGFVLAAAHRDDSVACGHVGRAFDQTRDMIAQAFAAAGYRVITLHMGNTQLDHHCDGTENAGDGNVAIIDLESR